MGSQNVAPDGGGFHEPRLSEGPGEARGGHAGDPWGLHPDPQRCRPVAHSEGQEVGLVAFSLGRWLLCGYYVGEESFGGFSL